MLINVKNVWNPNAICFEIKEHFIELIRYDYERALPMIAIISSSALHANDKRYGTGPIDEQRKAERNRKKNYQNQYNKVMICRLKYFSHWIYPSNCQTKQPKENFVVVVAVVLWFNCRCFGTPHPELAHTHTQHPNIDRAHWIVRILFFFSFRWKPSARVRTSNYSKHYYCVQARMHWRIINSGRQCFDIVGMKNMIMMMMTSWGSHDHAFEHWCDFHLVLKKKNWAEQQNRHKRVKPHFLFACFQFKIKIMWKSLIFNVYRYTFKTTH